MRSFRSRKIAPALAALCFGLAAAGASVAQDLDMVAEEPPAAPALAEELADWVRVSGDNKGLPFAVVDKTAAEVRVYGADGLLLGTTPALLGEAAGDDATPGVGDRELSDIAPEERTTPAGRFLAFYGPATGGRRVLWVDYSTAISLHPVVTSNPKERRLQRLKSATVDDNRITYGCINVPRAFYRNVVQAAFKPAGGVVYVLPDTKPLTEVFPGLSLQHAQAEEPAAAGRQLAAW